MGRKDIHTTSYFEDNERFADLVNGTLHGGNEVIKPGELSETDKEFVYAYGQNTKKIIADNAKLWEKGKIIFALYSIENLTYVDYSIVIRCMLTEAFGYDRQRKKHAEKVRRRTDVTGDEFLSGMTRRDTYYPVIPIVIYYGTEKTWDAETTLYGLLGLDEGHMMSPYINNYKVNLFDFHNYDSFNQFHTEVKTLFEFLRYSKDKTALNDIMDKNTYRYSHVDHETCSLIQVLTGNRALAKYKREENKNNENNISKETEGGEWNMCQAFEDYRMDGVREGEAKGKLIQKVTFLRKKYNKSMFAEEAAELFEIDITEVEEIYKLLEDHPDEDDLSIANRLFKEELVFA